MYVWPCIIYENDERYQLDATIVIYYHKYLYMFRASICPSSGVQVVCYCIWCSALGVVAVVLKEPVCSLVHCVSLYPIEKWRDIYDNKSQLLHQVGTARHLPHCLRAVTGSQTDRKSSPRHGHRSECKSEVSRGLEKGTGLPHMVFLF